jgi:hypothetical protein
MALKRTATAARSAPPKSGGSVTFGEDSFYTGGLGLPEGKYAMEFNTQMFQPTKQNGQPVGSPFLCVMATCYPIDETGALVGEPSEHPFSCGRKAHESFVPSADGKGFDAVPGGTSVGMNDMTNWSLFRKSMRDCGLPEGVLQNDLTVIDGIWVQTKNVPEPEGRKELRSATGEAALMGGQPGQEQRSRTVPVVTEILAKPWEGQGGIPDGNAAPAAAPQRRQASAAPAAKPAARRAAAPPPPPAETNGEEVSDEQLMEAAMEAMTDFLATPQNAAGATKLALRNGTFAAAQQKYGDDMAQAVIETFFADDAALNSVLNQLDFRTFGPKVVPVQPAK